MGNLKGQNCLPAYISDRILNVLKNDSARHQDVLLIFSNVFFLMYSAQKSMS